MSDKKYIDGLIKDSLEELKSKNKIFVSERDFQLELAWMMKLKNESDSQKIEIKLEYSPKMTIGYINKDEVKKDKNIYIDILIIYNGKWYPIELKYKTRKFEINDEELINLKEQSARDQGRCNFLWDISRLQILKKNISYYAKGYAIFLTNDLNYKNKISNRKTADSEFSLHEKRIIKKEKELEWKRGTPKGTIGGCPRMIKFEYDVELKEWNEYINIKQDKKKNGKFEYLKVEVE